MYVNKLKNHDFQYIKICIVLYSIDIVALIK